MVINSDTNHTGTLSLRIGPMYSGKTTWLNSELTQLADKGFSVLKITHSDDIRNDTFCNDNSGSTHNSSYTSLSKKITTMRCSDLSSIDVTNFHVIGVDESHFFSNLVSNVSNWVEIQHKHVRVVGLDGDFHKKKFGETLDLIPLCDDVYKLSATCHICLDELKSSNFKGNLLAIQGPFTKRLIDSTEQKLVGTKMYISTCRYHHSSNN